MLYVAYVFVCVLKCVCFVVNSGLCCMAVFVCIRVFVFVCVV